MACGALAEAERRKVRMPSAAGRMEFLVAVEVAAAFGQRAFSALRHIYERTSIKVNFISN